MKKLLCLVLALVLMLSVFTVAAHAEADTMTIEWMGGHDTDAISEGDTVLASLPPTHLHLFGADGQALRMAEE